MENERINLALERIKDIISDKKISPEYRYYFESLSEFILKSFETVNIFEYIKEKLKEKGYKLFVDSYTNQQFVIISDEKLKELSEKVALAYVEKYDDTHSIVRFCTSFATKDEDVKKLIDLL